METRRRMGSWRLCHANLDMRGIESLKKQLEFSNFSLSNFDREKKLHNFAIKLFFLSSSLQACQLLQLQLKLQTDIDSLTRDKVVIVGVVTIVS